MSITTDERSVVTGININVIVFCFPKSIFKSNSERVRLNFVLVVRCLTFNGLLIINFIGIAQATLSRLENQIKEIDTNIKKMPKDQQAALKARKTKVCSKKNNKQ